MRVGARALHPLYARHGAVVSTLPAPQRFRKSSLQRPLHVDYPRTQCLVWDACFSTPSSYRLLFPIPFNHSITPLIVGLLIESGPSAVARRVGAIVVNAIDFMLGRRSRPHVGIESNERFAPSRTDANPSGSIPPMSSVSGRMASANHVLVNRIFRRLGQAVRDVSVSRDLALKTATRASVCIAKMNNGNPDGCAAIASALSLSCAQRPRLNAQDNKATYSVMNIHSAILSQ